MENLEVAAELRRMATRLLARADELDGNADKLSDVITAREFGNHAIAERIMDTVTPVVTGEAVGLTAGVSKDGVTVLIDAAIPDTLETSRGLWNVHESIELHERVEHAIMGRGYDYPEAHSLATEVEHAVMRAKGFDPVEIEELMKPYIDEAKHRAKAEGSTAEVDPKPYVDSDETELLSGGTEDTREFYDRDGNCYASADTIKLLDEVPMLLCHGDRCAVVEPHTGMVYAVGRTPERATAEAESKARRTGLKRLLKEIEAETPQSQEQLREKFSGPHLGE